MASDPLASGEKHVQVGETTGGHVEGGRRRRRVLGGRSKGLYSVVRALTIA